MEDFHEITDSGYLEQIRAGKVTYLEVLCGKGHLDKRSGVALAEAIKATNTAVALDIHVQTQEPGALSAVLEALSACPTLTALYLPIKGKDILLEADIDSLSQVIRNCSSLAVLNISYLQILPDQQLKIIQACSSSNTLNTLYVRGWLISPEAIFALAQLLETSPTLRFLDLLSNGITPNELSVLLKGASKNSASVLDELILGDNPIGDVGLAALATYMRLEKIKLKLLDLGFTGLDDDCADSLFEIINGNSQLESLLCGPNELGIRALQKIALALQNNHHLIKLDLHANAFHGNQRLAAVTDMSEVPKSSAQLLRDIDLKLIANRAEQNFSKQQCSPSK